MYVSCVCEHVCVCMCCCISEVDAEMLLRTNRGKSSVARAQNGRWIEMTLHVCVLVLSQVNLVIRGFDTQYSIKKHFLLCTYKLWDYKKKFRIIG
jgi:hypothetical protein